MSLKCGAYPIFRPHWWLEDEGNFLVKPTVFLWHIFFFVSHAQWEDVYLLVMVIEWVFMVIYGNLR